MWKDCLKSNGQEVIFGVVDQLSKYALFVPVSPIKCQVMANAFVKWFTSMVFPSILSQIRIKFSSITFGQNNFLLQDTQLH